MKSLRWLILIFVIVGAVGIVGYYRGFQSSPEAPKAVSVTPVSEPSPSTTLPSPPATEEIKKDESSAKAAAQSHFVIDKKKSFAEVLGDFFGKDQFTALFQSDDLARRFVTSMEAATGEVQPAAKNSPLKSPDSDFMVIKKSDKTEIDPQNFHRYDAYVDLLTNADSQKMAQIYFHFYSLFKGIYTDLGSGKSFNTQVVDVIDHLLQTPDVRKPLLVFQPMPNGKYLFVDDELENLTPAQKLLLRMGNDHEHAVKEKLREIRKYLTQFGRGKK